MLNILISVVGMLFTILFVIGTHEAAHFWVARQVGVKVLRFSIGFGKKLFAFTDKKGTEYVFALIPLGGYVQMLDEKEGAVPTSELHLAYNRQPLYKKMLIVLAGPTSNLFCAVLLYWCIFMMGFTAIKPVIQAVQPHSIAAQAGVKSNQLITQVDEYPVKTWSQIFMRVIAHAGDENILTLQTKSLANLTISSSQLNLAHWHLDELKPDPLLSLGIIPYQPLGPIKIAKIKANSPASKYFKTGDEIVKVNSLPIKDWESLLTIIQNNPDKLFQFTIKRSDKTLTVPITIGEQRQWLFFKTGYLGITPDIQWPKAYLQQIKYGPIQALSKSFKEMGELLYFNFLIMKKLITGKLSLQTLGGPILIFESAGSAIHQGIVVFLGFLAFLSIAIGVINFLPVPGLDGGHLLFQIIEAIIRRPIPDVIIYAAYRLGLLFIFFMFAVALMNDLSRW